MQIKYHIFACSLLCLWWETVNSENILTFYVHLLLQYVSVLSSNEMNSVKCSICWHTGWTSWMRLSCFVIKNISFRLYFLDRKDCKITNHLTLWAVKIILLMSNDRTKIIYVIHILIITSMFIIYIKFEFLLEIIRMGITRCTAFKDSRSTFYALCIDDQYSWGTHFKLTMSSCMPVYMIH
jgi:hypothetical protein